MGYTHYWTHRRRFTNEQWGEIIADISAILHTAKDEGLALGDGHGETELSPISDMLDSEHKMLAFNGLGGDSHETFCLYQNRRPLDEWQKPSQRGWDFCKTARKPYDVAVTAVLCYLESVYPGQLDASSDGYAQDWKDGLALAGRALPTKTNMLAIPFEIRFDEQFEDCNPLVSRAYGKTYSLRLRKGGEWCVLRNGIKFVAHYPAAMKETFEARAVQVLSKVPTSGYMHELESKRDKAIRTLMAMLETVEGPPADALTLP